MTTRTKTDTIDKHDESASVLSGSTEDDDVDEVSVTAYLKERRSVQTIGKQGTCT